MTRLRHKIVQFNMKWALIDRILVVRRFFRLLWDRILMCSVGQPPNYHLLTHCPLPSSPRPLPDSASTTDSAAPMGSSFDSDSDLVALKISLLGDCHIGKTSFMIKYVGEEEEQRSLQMSGLNLMDKVLFIGDARIAFSVWDVGGDHPFVDHVPLACKDAAAILIMFDLTSRCTLNSVVDWYLEARKWNQTAIPILIGTKFDDFVHLPLYMQWAIVCQARIYARAMNATLFFSSATHNINVNKIFKFITAKLFNLPWALERNLTIGEPIIDF